MTLDSIYEQLVTGTKEFFTKNNFQKGVLGVSGGIDSALTLKIAVDALGAENVAGILMPELGVSAQSNIDHAQKLCDYFGVKTFKIPINNYLVDFHNLPWKPTELAMMNVKPRVRMAILYNYANTKEALVLGTSNLSEIMVGYGTKFGDLAADVEVIGSLYKTEIYQIAEKVGLPEEILKKEPSAELKAGQKDRDELKGSYKEIDAILRKLEEGLELDQIVDRGLPPNLVRHIARLVETNEHKRKLPPVIPVNK